jgi:hypothetical protein
MEPRKSQSWGLNSRTHIWPFESLKAVLISSRKRYTLASLFVADPYLGRNVFYTI